MRLNDNDLIIDSAVFVILETLKENEHFVCRISRTIHINKSFVYEQQTNSVCKIIVSIERNMKLWHGKWRVSIDFNFSNLKSN